MWAARPSAAPLHRASANSSVTFMLSPVRGMVTGGCGVGIIEDGELCWQLPGHMTICCNFGEPDGYGFADKVSFKNLLILPAQPFVIILYLHNEITKNLETILRQCYNTYYTHRYKLFKDAADNLTGMMLPCSP